MAKKKLKEWTSQEIEQGKKSAQSWRKFFAHQGDEIERGEEIDLVARAGAAADRYEAKLLARPNVVGVGVSLKEKKGQPNGQVSLSVFVEKKKPATTLGNDAVPDKIDDVETDVVEVGRLEPLMFSSRVRPAMPGYSVGHGNVTAGTFGCLVQDLRAPAHQHLVLGNNHVLADTNRGRLGDPILQPGPYDGGQEPADTVAILERFEPIHFGIDDGAYNLVDAAVARPVDCRQITAAVIGSLIPQGVGQAFLGDRVLKAGRTTGVTEGRVISVNATVVVHFPEGPALFRHQIVTTFMSNGGDSGSLLMDRHLSAVGLIFGGSPFVTVASHIADVESALGIRTMTAPRQRSGAAAGRRQLGLTSETAGDQPVPRPDLDDDGPQPVPRPDLDDDEPQSS